MLKSVKIFGRFGKSINFAADLRNNSLSIKLKRIRNYETD